MIILQWILYKAFVESQGLDSVRVRAFYGDQVNAHLLRHDFDGNNNIIRMYICIMFLLVCYTTIFFGIFDDDDYGVFHLSTQHLYNIANSCDNDINIFVFSRASYPEIKWHPFCIVKMVTMTYSASFELLVFTWKSQTCLSLMHNWYFIILRSEL